MKTRERQVIEQLAVYQDEPDDIPFAAHLVAEEYVDRDLRDIAGLSQDQAHNVSYLIAKGMIRGVKLDY